MTAASAAAPAEAEAEAEAEFWFDPLCPWAWITSRWMLEVEKVRPVKVTWSLMSLSYLNRERDLGADYNALMQRAWGPVRIVAAATAAKGPDIIGPIYTAIGTQFHNNGRGRTDPGGALKDALDEVGLPDLISALEDTTFDEAIIASHERGIGLVGTEVGTPIISVEGVGFFGPVVTPIPRGEPAGRLWDGMRLMASVPGFYELKRTRTERPSFD